MMTLLEIVQRSSAYLKEKGIANPQREAEEVIADALGVKRLDLYLQHDRPLSEQELPGLRKSIQRRSQREPTAYIAGSVMFCGVKLAVTPAVLIPRPETEILVEKIAQTLGQIGTDGKVLWDICCGSGCIGLALKKRFPDLRVILSDLSGDALALAEKNAQANGLDSTFKQGDLFKPFQGLTCDFFVSNPPYIAKGEFTQLSPEVREWEPEMALVSGSTGLEYYHRIAQELKKYLAPQGLGWLELGTGQGAHVQNIFTSEGFTCHYESDWSGHDRFFFICYK